MLDLAHLQLLVATYCPNYTPKPISRRLRALPLADDLMDTGDSAYVHFFQGRFAELRQSLSAPNPCRGFQDIGKASIPVTQRAAFFVGTLAQAPSNPKQFRPAPHATAPLDFKNPYSSALALAYDYLAFADTAAHAKFAALADGHAYAAGIQPSPMVVLQCWACFAYPALLSPQHAGALSFVAKPSVKKPYSRSQPKWAQPKESLSEQLKRLYL